METYSVRLSDPTNPDKNAAMFVTLTGFSTIDEAWDAGIDYLRNDPRWATDQAVFDTAARFPSGQRPHTAVDLRQSRADGGRPVSIRVFKDPA